MVNTKSIVNELNEECISDELEVNFKENNRRLSKDAKVSAKEKRVWQIENYEPEERHYRVKKEGEKLNVYERGSAELEGGTR